MSIETWLAFALASALVVVIPGPVVIFVLGRSLGSGWRAALPTVAGVAAGDALAMAVALAGLGALLAASATAFTVVKWAGAAYLLWLGWRMWRAPVPDGLPPPLPAATAFRDAFVVTVLNPKSIGFFVAFVPQFIAADRALLPQGAALVATFTALGVVNAMAYARLAGRISSAVRRPRVRRALNRAGGGMLMAAGAATAMLKRA
ncbi:MAG: LysE family translocator [Acetobacteraceae bacterium]|nr:LysE family translocator [Acetobacteraceae bacterium]